MMFFICLMSSLDKVSCVLKAIHLLAIKSELRYATVNLCFYASLSFAFLDPQKTKVLEEIIK